MNFIILLRVSTQIFTDITLLIACNVFVDTELLQCVLVCVLK